jgi:hypothetical protein
MPSITLVVLMPFHIRWRGYGARHVHARSGDGTRMEGNAATCAQRRPRTNTRSSARSTSANLSTLSDDRARLSPPRRDWRFAWVGASRRPPSRCLPVTSAAGGGCRPSFTVGDRGEAGRTQRREARSPPQGCRRASRVVSMKRCAGAFAAVGCSAYCILHRAVVASLATVGSGGVSGPAECGDLMKGGGPFVLVAVPHLRRCRWRQALRASALACCGSRLHQRCRG